MYESVIFALNASISKTSVIFNTEGIATTKLLYVVPVFRVNGFRPSVNILFVSCLTSELLNGTELVEP